MKTYYIKLKKGEKGTLNTILEKHLKLSKADAERLIYYGSVWIKDNFQRIKDKNRTITTETLMIYKPDYPVKEYPFEAEDIIYEDKFLLVLSKKPGFPTVPTPYGDISSLSFGLTEYLKTRNETAFVINRLDLATGGLVIYGKTKKSEKALHRLFKERLIKKWYLVKTEKNYTPEKRYFIEDKLEWKGKKKHAKTVIGLLKEDDRFYYFTASPKTGRTHQIRKHFTGYIHPIYGDSAYGPYTNKYTLGLFCFAYIFNHPFTGKKMVIKHIPGDFFASPAECSKG